MENIAHTSPNFDSITIEAILDSRNLLEALRKVETNRGAPGVDGMEVDDLRQYIHDHPGALTDAIRTGKYRPSPVKRVSIPKPERGKFRDLGIPTVIDRLVQQAVAQVMSRYYDITFSNSSFGFRPNRSAHDAIFKVVDHTDSKFVWVVDMDLEKFFDTVNHSRLIRKLSERIKDKRVISLIHRMLTSGISTDEGMVKSECGVMQGGPLSPLLANIYLDELDKELERRGHRFVRYADDMMIMCKTKRAAERTLASISKVIEGRMLLKINKEKTVVSFVTKGVKFLGYSFHWKPKVKRIVPGVHPKSKKKLKEKIKEILGRSRGRSFAQVREELLRALRGWNNYFQLAEYQTWMKDTDEWIRRRIRQLYWKTWKKVKTKYKALRKLGCTEGKAWEWANTRQSYWHIANSFILSTTATNDFLKIQGWTWLSLTAKPIGWK